MVGVTRLGLWPLIVYLASFLDFGHRDRTGTLWRTKLACANVELASSRPSLHQLSGGLSWDTQLPELKARLKLITEGIVEKFLHDALVQRDLAHPVGNNQGNVTSTLTITFKYFISACFNRKQILNVTQNQIIRRGIL